MANEKDPKIVPGGDVNFAEGNAQADSLDVAVAEATSKGSLFSWRVENMNYLAEQVWPVIACTYKRGKKSEQPTFLPETAVETSPALKGMIPYWAFLLPNRRDHSLAEFFIGGQEVIPCLVRPLLEEKYGVELRESGLYQTIGLDKEQKVPVWKIAQYFPEVARIKLLNERVIPLTRNPYVPVLSLPIECRPLVVGVLRELRIVVDNSQRGEWSAIQVATPDILAYARKVNEVENLHSYLKLLVDSLKTP